MRGLHVFFTRQSKHLEGDRLPVCSQISCCVKRRKRADCPVCLTEWENRKNHGIDVRLEECPIHTTSETLTHYVVNYRVRTNAVVSQELFQLT